MRANYFDILWAQPKNTLKVEGNLHTELNYSNNDPVLPLYETTRSVIEDLTILISTLVYWHKTYNSFLYRRVNIQGLLLLKHSHFSIKDIKNHWM